MNSPIKALRGYKRLGNFPLDDSSIFSSLDNANNYLLTSEAYAGQVIAVSESDSDAVLYLVGNNNSVLYLNKISTDIEKNELINLINESSVLGRTTLADYNISDAYTKTETNNFLSLKVDKVIGKNLSDENFTATLQEKLNGIEINANNYSHPIYNKENDEFDVPFTLSHNEPFTIVTDINTENGHLINLIKQKLNLPAEYTLPIASNEALGGIKVGNGLQISNNGILSINNSEINPTNYETKADASAKLLTAKSYTDSEFLSKVTNKLGNSSGIATLDENGKVISSQLPSYVDDVLEYEDISDFPLIGESGKIYISLENNLTYRWTGTQYSEISSSIALGETSSTAYAGNKGKANADNITLHENRISLLENEIINKAGISTTLNGYGITDAYTKTEANELLEEKSNTEHTHTFASLISKPTSLAGYGITDAYTKTENDNIFNTKSNLGHTHIFSDLTTTPTSLAGYGITDAYTKTEINSSLASYLPLTGGVMSGGINLSSDENIYNTKGLIFENGVHISENLDGNLGIFANGTVTIRSGSNNGTNETNGITIANDEISPTNNNTSLGSSTNKYANLYLDGVISNGTRTYSFPRSLSGTIALTSNIPTNNNQLTNGAGYITGISSSNVISALGYTPYNSTNPNGYTSNVGTITDVKVNNETVVSGSIANIDLSSYATTNDLVSGLNSKQGNLTAGTGILIENNEISLNLEIANETLNGLMPYTDKIKLNAYPIWEDLSSMLSAKANQATTYTKAEIDSFDYVPSSDLNSKQDILVSGENIKTINGQSILGTGNINVEVNNITITETSPSISVVANTDYNCTNSIESLTLTSVENSREETLIYFTANQDFYISAPSSAIIISDGLQVLSGSSYVLSIRNNTLELRGFNGEDTREIINIEATSENVNYYGDYNLTLSPNKVYLINWSAPMFTSGTHGVRLVNGDPRNIKIELHFLNNANLTTTTQYVGFYSSGATTSCPIKGFQQVGALPYHATYSPYVRNDYLVILTPGLKPFIQDDGTYKVTRFYGMEIDRQSIITSTWLGNERADSLTIE